MARPSPWNVLPLFLCLAACATAQGGGSGVDDDTDLRQDEADLAQDPVDLRRDLMAGAGDLRPAQDLMSLADLMTPADMRPITGCTVTPQSGCPAGMKCTTHDGTSTICDPNGAVARGKPCIVTGGVDNCVAGSVCIDEGGGLSLCRAYCSTDASCGANSYCDSSLNMAHTLNVCTQACTALFPGAGCEPGFGCYGYNGTFSEHTDCLRAGTKTESAVCAAVNECLPGMDCVGGVGAFLCRKICRQGMAGTCDVNRSCQNPFSWAVLGLCCPAGGC